MERERGRERVQHWAGHSLEDLPGVMEDRDEWRERERKREREKMQLWTGHSLKDLIGVMEDRDEWRESVREIHVVSIIWWWSWWWWFSGMLTNAWLFNATVSFFQGNFMVLSNYYYLIIKIICLHTVTDIFIK